jgi:hydroxymethylbilane synthase
MRIGTRRSALALAQANLIAELIGGDCEIVPIVTSGDADARTPAPDTDKSRWVTELEDALTAQEIDLAVHSAKDLPGELADGLALHGAPARAGAQDVLCGASTLAALETGARVGTSSIRRLAQLRAAREDLEVVAVRGNVDTRLRKGLEAQIGGVLDGDHFVPAPGQGVLALEGRAGDERTVEAVRTITHGDSFACLLAERALAHELGASCHTPLGAHANSREGALNLRAWVGVQDGSAWIEPPRRPRGARTSRSRAHAQRRGGRAAAPRGGAGGRWLCLRCSPTARPPQPAASTSWARAQATPACSPRERSS